MYDDITSQIGDALFNQYFTQGSQAYVNKDYAGAAAALQQAVDSDKEGKAANYKNALYYLGFAYYNQGDYTKADEIFKAYIEKYPNEASAIQPYMNGGASSSGSGAGSQSASQGEASVNSSNPTAQTNSSQASASGSSQSGTGAGAENITVYGNSTQTPQVAWTDPVTGQNYDMYGNQINAQ